MSRSITIIRESRIGVTGLMLESMNFKQLYEAVENDDESKKSFMKKLWEKFRDSEMVDLGLDLLGVIAGNVAAAETVATAGFGAPGLIVAMIPDLLNAFRRFARGDKFQGALSLICAIPLGGDALADLIAAKRLFGDNTKTAITVVKSVASWAKDNLSVARKAQGAAERVVDSVVEHVPEMKKHREEMKRAVDVMTSGDKKKMIALAKESGMKIEHDVADDSGAKEAVAESRTRRPLRLVDLYEGTLYESRSSQRNDIDEGFVDYVSQKAAAAVQAATSAVMIPLISSMIGVDSSLLSAMVKLKGSPPDADIEKMISDVAKKYNGSVSAAYSDLIKKVRTISSDPAKVQQIKEKVPLDDKGKSKVSMVARQSTQRAEAKMRAKSNLPPAVPGPLMQELDALFKKVGVPFM